jgi:hypothetical protein
MEKEITETTDLAEVRAPGPYPIMLKFNTKQTNSSQEQREFPPWLVREEDEDELGKISRFFRQRMRKRRVARIVCAGIYFWLVVWIVRRVGWWLLTWKKGGGRERVD